MTAYAATGLARGVGEPSVFVAAAEWIQGVLLGSFATALAVVAVATVGLLMMSGRVNLRRGMTVILGCFILFGATNIANGLRGLAASRTPSVAGRQTSVESAYRPSEPPAAEASTVIDNPYAGATIRPSAQR